MAVAVAAAGSAVSAVDRRSVSARQAKHGASIKRVYRDAILKRLRTRKQQ